ncbi:MAG: hypothetical protein GWO07_06745 [Candidatus Dadabacteria bacterium]|nr:hypothetical protein [Candidatus Dadabacteria bacterium]NIS08450.1 hypothetical protein [Candidatus Dadabacteria bacterium]NIY21938.1 hypothetical protein [Candidatus Dadabacteria bacterium]
MINKTSSLISGGKTEKGVVKEYFNPSLILPLQRGEKLAASPLLLAGVEDGDNPVGVLSEDND